MRFLQIQIILTALIFLYTNIKAQNCDYDSTNIVQYTNEVEQDTTYIDTNTLQGRPQPSLPTDRIVYWVHGLGGDETSWSRAAAIAMSGKTGVDFDEREIKSENEDIEYSGTEANLDMDGLAINLASKMDEEANNHDNGNYDWEDGIVFGHSQGGVLSRLMDERFDAETETASIKAYGGIVTFATSNQGARIINNKELIQDALESFANDMAAGPFSMLTDPKSSILRILVVKPFNIDHVLEELKNIAAKSIGEYLLSEDLPAITEEYKVGGSAVNRINSYTTNSTDLVAFYGEKPKVYYKTAPYYNDEGELWAVWNLPHAISWVTIHYFLNASTDYDYFKAHEYESETPVNVFLTRRNYVSNKLEEEELIDRLNDKHDQAWCNPIILGNACIARQLVLEDDIDAAETRRDAWNRGIRALDNFNEQHLIVIGARVREEVEEEDTKVCICEKGGWVIHYEEDLGPLECARIENQNPGWTCYLSEQSNDNTFTWVEKPSDGVVLSESASDIPQATHPPQLMEGNLLNEEDIGTTHMQLRNDITTKKALNKIFDGDVGLFFKTDKRQ